MNVHTKKSQASLPQSVRNTVSNTARLKALREYVPMDFEADPDFDALTSLAANTFNAPIALISLVDDDIQWFRSKTGIDRNQTEIDASFCAHAISQKHTELFIVENASEDPRFSTNRLVTGSPGIRFYAGHTIQVADEKIGTLCVIDNKPRDSISETQKESLASLASLAASLVELKYSKREKQKTDSLFAEQSIRKTLHKMAANTSNWAWYPSRKAFNYDALLREKLDLPKDGECTLDQLLERIETGAAEEIREKLTSGEWATEQTFRYEFASRDGSRWFELIGRSSPESDGEAANAILGVVFETTYFKKNEKSKRDLLRELNHRVKNTLAILQSLSKQTAKIADSSEDYNKIFLRRVQSVNMTHGLLSESEWMDVPLADIVKSQLALEDNNSAFPVDLPNVELTPDQAFGVGLILHELFNVMPTESNDSKAGSERSLTGKLNYTADSKDTILQLVWIEKLPNSQPKLDGKLAKHRMELVGRGLGKVLDSLVKVNEIDGGLRVTISFPINHK